MVDFRARLTVSNLGGAVILALVGPLVYWLHEGSTAAEGQIAAWVWSGLIPLGLIVLGAVLWDLYWAPIRDCRDRTAALEVELEKQRVLRDAERERERVVELRKELSALIHTGVAIRAYLPDQDDKANWDLNLVRAQLEWEPEVSSWDKSTWEWVRTRAAEHMGFLTARHVDASSVPALRALPGFVTERIDELRKVLERIE